MIKIILKYNQSYQTLVIIQILHYKFFKIKNKKSSQKGAILNLKYQIVIRKLKLFFKKSNRTSNPNGIFFIEIHIHHFGFGHSHEIIHQLRSF